MANTRLYYASAVLDDGRVFVAGGEYSDAGGDTNKAELSTGTRPVVTSSTPSRWKTSVTHPAPSCPTVVFS